MLQNDAGDKNKNLENIGPVVQALEAKVQVDKTFHDVHVLEVC